MRRTTTIITGGAGFLGYHTASELAQQGHQVVIIDNMNDYYDTALKYKRLQELKSIYKDYISFYPVDITESLTIDTIFGRHEPEYVIHLAAQAGVRYSRGNPMAYTHSNLMGTTVILEACKKFKPQHVLYASSSSVYGNAQIPFQETQTIGEPLSYYAVTKRTNELTANVFNLETGIPITGLRFFTAYGPWGRPDMAYWSFAEKILAGDPITVYGDGVARDFTYCTDVAEAIRRLMIVPQKKHHVVNIGNQNPHTVSDLVTNLSQCFDKSAIVVPDQLPSCDPQITCCDNTYLTQLTGYTPQTSFQDGIELFAEWYLNYKNKNK